MCTILTFLTLTLGLPPGRDWPPGICVPWCSSTWTRSTLNNLWRCTPAGRRLGTMLWRDALWSVRRHPPAVYCWEVRRLEPTCSSTSERWRHWRLKEGGEGKLLLFKTSRTCIKLIQKLQFFKLVHIEIWYPLVTLKQFYRSFIFEFKFFSFFKRSNKILHVCSLCLPHPLSGSGSCPGWRWRCYQSGWLAGTGPEGSARWTAGSRRHRSLWAC